MKDWKITIQHDHLEVLAHPIFREFEDRNLTPNKRDFFSHIFVEKSLCPIDSKVKFAC